MTDEIVNNIENHSFDGNVAVGRDLVTGGQLVARGNSIFNRNVLVEGWLTAKNIRITDQGVESEQTHVYKNGIISEALSYFKKGIVSNELSYFLKVSL